MSDLKNEQTGNSLTGFTLNMNNAKAMMVSSADSDSNVALNNIVLQSVMAVEYHGVFRERLTWC